MKVWINCHLEKASFRKGASAWLENGKPTEQVIWVALGKENILILFRKSPINLGYLYHILEWIRFVPNWHGRDMSEPTEDSWPKGQETLIFDIKKKKKYQKKKNKRMGKKLMAGCKAISQEPTEWLRRQKLMWDGLCLFHGKSRDARPPSPMESGIWVQKVEFSKGPDRERIQNKYPFKLYLVLSLTNQCIQILILFC